MKRWVLGLLAVGIVGGGFVLAGGVGWLDSTGMLGQDRLVRSRVEAYWQARRAGDLTEMSRYEHPEQQWSADPKMLETAAYEIRSIEIDGEEAVAVVAFTARLKHPQFSRLDREIVANDRWVRYDGDWHREKHPMNIKELLGEARQRLHPSGKPAPDETGSE